MERYEEWDVSIPPIPPRSRLYHLEPIGIGTPYVESLTSYVARLAAAHSVHPRDLLIHELAPHLSQLIHLETQEVKRGTMSPFFGNSAALNGTTASAGKLIQGLAFL